MLCSGGADSSDNSTEKYSMIGRMNTIRPMIIAMMIFRLLKWTGSFLEKRFCFFGIVIYINQFKSLEGLIDEKVWEISRRLVEK